MINFKPLYDLFKRAELLSDDKAWMWSMNDRFVQREIIRMNTIDQLFDEGIDSKGASLGEYSSVTVKLKKAKGQPTNRVTLFDEGDFYRSFRIIVNKDFFTIDADDFSKYDRPLFEVYGNDVVGLTDFNKKRLQSIIKQKYIDYAKKYAL